MTATLLLILLIAFGSSKPCIVYVHGAAALYNASIGDLTALLVPGCYCLSAKVLLYLLASSATARARRV